MVTVFATAKGAEWIDLFKTGPTNVIKKERSRLPSIWTTEGDFEEISSYYRQQETDY
jgi:hypothetical protein